MDHDVPNDVVRDPMVFMPQDVADAADSSPWNIRCLLKQLIGNVSSRFGNNLNGPLDCEA